MFFWKKKRLPETDLSWLGADIHSHLLPGIDDGVPDMESALNLIEGMQALGYRKIITTPHILSEVYPNSPEIIKEKKNAVEQALSEAGIMVDFSAAAEYYIDESFQKKLEHKEPLLTLHKKLVLVEFSMITAPMDLLNVFFEMQLQGYQPVVAHPERYIYLQSRKTFFHDLKSSGCQLQLNLLSLTPHYGKSVQRLAEFLVKEKLYDYAGSDMHGERHLHALQHLASAPLYGPLQDAGILKNHLLC